MVVFFQERHSLQGLLLRRQLAAKHREMLNVLVVEQQQKQVQYLELLKQHEASWKASTTQQKEEAVAKESSLSLPQQQREIVDLTVSKNKEENHQERPSESLATSVVVVEESKSQSET